MSEPRKFSGGNLKGEAAAEGSILTVKLSGAGDFGGHDGLSTFMVGVHADAQAAKVQQVVVDLRGLSFMSSSCFKVFVSWLNSVTELPAGQQYRVKFLPDSAQHWQRRSLGALAAFGGALVEVAG